MHRLAAAILLAGAFIGPVRASAQPSTLRHEVEALHSSMVAAFKLDPATVARYYTDDATIMGGGARSVGREQIDRYWRESPSGAQWTLEVLEVGGDTQTPWVRGRSTLAGPGGRGMVADYVGILKRGTDGQLRFYVDIYVGARGGMRPPGGTQ